MDGLVLLQEKVKFATMSNFGSNYSFQKYGIKSHFTFHFLSTVGGSNSPNKKFSAGRFSESWASLEYFLSPISVNY